MLYGKSWSFLVLLTATLVLADATPGEAEQGVIENIKARKEPAFLTQCKIDKYQKDVVVIPVSGKEAIFRRVQYGLSIPVVIGRMVFKEGEIALDYFTGPATAEPWFFAHAQEMIEYGKFSFIRPQDADTILTSIPDKFCATGQ